PSGRRLRGNGGPERDSLIPDPEPGGGTTVDSDHRPKRKGRSKRKKDEPKPLSDQQQRIVDQLTVRGDPVPLGELLEAAGTSVSAVRTLERRGILEVFAREVRRDPLGHIEVGSQPRPIQLTPDQQQAVDLIIQKLDERQYSTVLLHGVTGSGKT